MAVKQITTNLTVLRMLRMSETNLGLYQVGCSRLRTSDSELYVTKWSIVYKKNVRTSLLFVRFVACGVSSQDTPCCHWCVHSSLARSITVISSGRNFRKSHTPVTVCHERRCTSRVLGEEFRSHHAVTPRTTLAQGSREDPFLARRARLPVPA